MNMVERVARAMLKSMDDDLDPDELTQTPLGRPLWMECEDQARVALSALREPSEQMIDAGVASDHTLEGMGPDYPTKEEGVTNIWQAMIDAALQEPTL